MITVKKLKEYEAFQGSEDSYSRQGCFENNIITGEEWGLIGKLTGEYKLVIRNLAASTYAETINEEIAENCDNKEAVAYLKKISENPW